MKFGVRKPSLKKRFASRTSWKRMARHNLGLKAPRGYGWVTNPKKAAYNRIYSRTTVPFGKGLGFIFILLSMLIMGIISLFKTNQNEPKKPDLSDPSNDLPPSDENQE